MEEGYVVIMITIIEIYIIHDTKTNLLVSNKPR
jgi:hypothetical protein